MAVTPALTSTPTADAAVPTWYVPYLTPNTHFLGDFADKQIGTLAFDINIFSGVQVPDRAVTLDLNTTLGTGDFTKGVDAYYIGTDISRLPAGWQTYKFPVNAASSTIPPGWVVTKGNGQPGTDADWQALCTTSRRWVSNWASPVSSILSEFGTWAWTTLESPACNAKPAFYSR